MIFQTSPAAFLIVATLIAAPARAQPAQPPISPTEAPPPPPYLTPQATLYPVLRAAPDPAPPQPPIGTQEPPIAPIVDMTLDKGSAPFRDSLRQLPQGGLMEVQRNLFKRQ